ncbi:glycoside hydrolase family 127 protein [Peterkaempfera sp. SMS 1(5)a]|uniref:glycoside hydrolase family 127 protein n=1 Tax=Peterkaempfera podocarpi TaxID=3232308 RepID=UPI00366BB89E
MSARPSPTTAQPSGPLRFGPRSTAALRPAAEARLTGGFWAQRRRVNAEVGIPQGPALLEAAGNLHNLRLAAGAADAPYRGDLPFMDSDVYKWLEAAAWQLGESRTPGGAGLAEETARIIGLVGAAQQPDGYLSSWFQVARPGERFTDLRWGHELYCAGHLIQAGVADHRATGRPELLAVARRFADHIDDTFGPGRQIDGCCGHPEIETALVELHRETGEQRYLDLARYFVDRRGHGLLADPDPGSRPAGAPDGPPTGPGYCQDRVPIRQARNVEGHAVRQLYLLAGATDVAIETGEPELTAAVERLWTAMAATKTHLTGGLGAHHDKEDFGDAYELPTERAYCETCAAVASVHWSWRMALLTGHARYSDLVERTLYNAVLPGVSLDGTGWLYVNPLQVRDGYQDHGGDQTSRRTAWFRCACCPPNVMRLLASLPHYVASGDDQGLQLHQYASGTWTAGGTDPVAVSVETQYPWQGRIAVTVERSRPGEWTLSLRLPQWCEQYGLYVGDRPVTAPAEDGWLRLRRAWEPGETVVLDLALEPRLTRADPRVDAVRGCVAIERGPLVYCVEQVDHPGGGLDDVLLDPKSPPAVKHCPDLLGGVVVVVASGTRLGLGSAGPQGGWWPYRSTADGSGAAPGGGTPLELTAVPYYAWANREPGSMRVWLPTTD